MGNLLSTNMFLFAFVFYGVAFVVYLAILASGKQKLSNVALLFVAVAFILHTLGIAYRISEFHHVPLTGMFEYMTITSWFAGATYFVVLKITKNWFVCFCNVFVIIILMVIVSLLPKDGNSSLVPVLQSSWLYIHVSAAALSEVLFGIGFVSSVAYLLKSTMNPNRWFYRRVPELTILDEITYRAIAVGYPLFTIGALFAGAIWAQRTWGTFWSWDPKETCSLIVWMIYSVYLHLRIKKGYRGKISHLVSIVGFLAALFTFLSTMFLGGLHSYG